MSKTDRESLKAAVDAWSASLGARDPAVLRDLRRAESAIVPELAVAGAEPQFDALVEKESIILRTGRPVLPMRGGRVSTQDAFIEGDSIEIVKRTRDLEENFAPFVASVGRIDVANSFTGLDWIGTGWLVDRDIVVTNRHVAELVAGESGGRFVFRPGKGGGSIAVSIDFLREIDSAGEAAFEVKEVIWIETNPSKADLALLRLKESPAAERIAIPLAASGDPAPTDVAVVGYPARAPQRIIPEQELMERIFAGRYDIKRIAPGLWGERSRDGWATHDCTTLGGNSGSVVFDMRTGKAVALHFAGAFMIENYAVEAATIKEYLRGKPWTEAMRSRPPEAGGNRDETDSGTNTDRPDPTSPPPSLGEVRLTIPLHLTLSFGTAVNADRATAARDQVATTIDEAVQRARRRHATTAGVVVIRSGFIFDSAGMVTDSPCIVVAVDAMQMESFAGTIEARIAGWPVDVRPADAEDLLDAALAPEAGLQEARGSGIAYNDEDRRAAVFALEPVEADLSMLCHVGPERSWPELKPFLLSANESLLSAMYEFNAAHIADAVEDRLGAGVEVRTVLDSVLARKQESAPDLFTQSEKFRAWQDRFERGFDFVYVPEGRNGLIFNSYHIKVAVRDGGNSFWLSSGNWKPSSQPSLDEEHAAGSSAALDGNREWHVIVEEKAPRRVTQCFAAHIKEDERFSRTRPADEAVALEMLIDVPEEELLIVDEAPIARRLLASKTVSGRLRIQPLLTPDRSGAAFCEPVVRLIDSAERSLWFQIPYITPHPDHAPQLLRDLVGALGRAARRVRDFRIILRADTIESLEKSVEALKKERIDVATMVRKRPQTHTKGMVVDGRHTLIGSHNWSGPGVTINRDASLIIFDNEDVAAYYGEAFAIDWDTSRTPTVRRRRGSGVRPAVTEAPPFGYVRMPLQAYLDR